MSFTWEKIGSFQTKIAAEDWCQRQGIAWNDSRIVEVGPAYELLVRSSALDLDDRLKRPWQL